MGISGIGTVAIPEIPIITLLLLHTTQVFSLPVISNHTGLYPILLPSFPPLPRT
ncbi:hypothetical protein BGLCM_0292 [Bifidobacterium gallicum DSM 20093 = LMG 11596]|uniref:Uncharacterized protein n=1 Tax=Bifidobacterium gallicum DSM 20093 = LMG 11596 TaxID=561180 RepID=A0A087ALH4_9BIFI|nr:hypothetical protein BGLCM_0292 [Bifidobacterium gallicum DSM 20093 = LMG 11596]